MGLFWELFQELQINKRKHYSNDLEARVSDLENELLMVEDVLEKTLQQLENSTGINFHPSNDDAPTNE